MRLIIPVDIEDAIRDKVACGDYRPVDSNTGPVNGDEWLALLEDEAEIQDDNEINNHGADAETFAKYAIKLRALATQLRAEGFSPICFHWQGSHESDAERVMAHGGKPPTPNRD